MFYQSSNVHAEVKIEPLLVAFTDVKLKYISSMLQRILYRPIEERKKLSYLYKNGDKNQFSNKKLKINFEAKVSNEIDYDLIQFGDDGMRFWIDFSSSKIKNHGILQFLRGVIIKTAIGRISSMIKPLEKEPLGPFTKKQLKKCGGRNLKVHKYYRKHSIGRYSACNN